MTISPITIRDASMRLHSYLVREHWNGMALEGPDSGIRFNSRIGRFIKSYLDFLPWSDCYTYMQAQAYWILDNWLMSDLLSNQQYSDYALSCVEYVLTAQQPGGYWEYPNPEWKGRIATVEGNYAALGLLESYCRTRREPLLASAKKWYQYIMQEVGFQGGEGMLAINYFSNVRGGMVPNNTASVLRFLAKLADATADAQYLALCDGMVAWLIHVQLKTGELPYSVANLNGEGRIHFLCYQYNAFEFLNLAKYYQLTDDRRILPVLERLAAYLATGISESGAARYDCHHERPQVLYYTAAVAAALSQAASLGLGDFSALADRAYEQVLAHQRADGGFEFFSRGNYGLLSDRRSYPRNLSMILNHLLMRIAGQAQPAAKPANAVEAQLAARAS